MLLAKLCSAGLHDFESLGVAADHDQELARLGRRLAARDRHVEQNDAAIGQTGGEPRHGAGRNRRSDPDDQPGPSRGGDSLRPQQDRFRLLVEADHNDDEIASFRHCAGVRRHGYPGTLCLLPHQRIDITRGHVEAGCAQMARHRMPHLAKPDDAYATNDALAHIPTFLQADVWRASTGLNRDALRIL